MVVGSNLHFVRDSRLSTSFNEGCAQSFIRVWGISSNLSEGAPLDLIFLFFRMLLLNMNRQDRGNSPSSSTLFCRSLLPNARATATRPLIEEYLLFYWEEGR